MPRPTRHCSGFRRLRRQRDMTCRCCRGTVPLMSRWCFSTAMCAKDGLELAIRYSAPPGQSEHQTGLCFDVASLYRTFATTEAGIWLNEHCAEYGFIIRYPENSEDITGYMYEPWHIRYVGEETAQAIMSQGITLEEYLALPEPSTHIDRDNRLYSNSIKERKGEILLNRGLVLGGGGSRRRL